MQIEVHNPNNLPTMDYRKWKPLQGDLKDLSEKNYTKLKKVLTVRGFRVPAYLWRNPLDEELYIVDAHQRQKVLVKENATPYELPYILIDAKDEAEAKAILLEISSQYGTITQEGFDTFIADLPEAEIMEMVNFDALTFGSTEEEVEEDEAPEVDESEPPKSQLGEIYQLGRHRVMCGDSTRGVDVTRLLDADPVLMVTDPPYGVNYDPEWRDGADLGVGERSKGKVMNDDRIDWSDAYSLFPGDVAYVWHAGKYTAEVARHLEYSGFEMVSQIIWNKQHFVMSRGDYHWKHEPLWYAVRKGKKHNYVGDRKQTTVWDIQNNNSFGNQNPEETVGHGTQKPIECMARPIRNNSIEDDKVYDPFLGSGSTLIACEQLDRICYGMELDPKYVDVIRKRYANLIGEEDWESVTPKITERLQNG